MNATQLWIDELWVSTVEIEDCSPPQNIRVLITGGKLWSQACRKVLHWLLTQILIGSWAAQKPEIEDFGNLWTRLSSISAIQLRPQKCDCAIQLRNVCQASKSTSHPKTMIWALWLRVWLGVQFGVWLRVWLEVWQGVHDCVGGTLTIVINTLREKVVNVEISYGGRRLLSERSMRMRLFWNKSCSKVVWQGYLGQDSWERGNECS